MSLQFYPASRIGCASCDFVGDLQKVIDEEEVHQFVCPYCGQQDLHHYPVVGSWPSDYEVPPCAETGKSPL
jgi:predicted RNA-binding Zn-ribbon protein involved in translation (DUF1610 family)